MAGGVKSNAAKARKRVEADNNNDNTNQSNTTSMVRGKDGSAFTRCEECGKTVAVALISMHSCSLDAKIKMSLDAQVVEKPTQVKKPAAATAPERKKSTSTEPKAKKPKGEKSKDASNKPKRPPTAFFLFMDDFRKTFKEQNPDSKDVKRVAKEGGEKWRSMAEEEKKLYVEKAAELKAEYNKALERNTAENEDGEAGSTSEKEDAEKEDAAAQEGQASDEE
ncbi:hypothetical protein K2173_006818 [Erythroxylum novogranatense]|uniref:HMG box domain-containing protein n=1 Tax=Erythroxylum novogranatense TaxID=1862640 RepID=A0AAV8SYA9_9ROSI|nr:hypothetical protein K2173_006818 [Erythroxylum novogranatense]